MESPCRVTCDTVRQSRSSLWKTDNPMTNENKRDLLLVIVCILPVHLTIVPYYRGTVAKAFFYCYTYTSNIHYTVVSTSSGKEDLRV